MTGAYILETRGLTKSFASPRLLRASDAVVAVDDVSIAVERGSTLGIVGESGSGKTTLGRMIVGLIPMSSGEVLLDGTSTRELSARELNARVQYVFQDPYSSLNPRRTVGAAIGVPLRHLIGLDDADRRRARVAELISHVGLRPELVDRYPHELSGGQRQRVGIARALAAEPDVLVLDEPVSALDVSIQAQILALLRELQAELRLTYLFVSHDLAVVESVCDEVVVLYGGKIVEKGTRDALFSTPQHEYTKRLLAAVPGGHGGRKANRPSPRAGSLAVDMARLRSDLERLAEFGATADGGVTRQAFSPAELDARQWLRLRAEEAGLTMHEDAVGNVFVRLEGPAGVAPVWTGSHLDSVPNGGRLDGALGVVAALECLRRLREANVQVARPVEALAFADEEGAFYGHLGSKAIVGAVDVGELTDVRGADGVRLLDVLSGQTPERSDVSPHAFVELHIEQGPTLEAGQTSIGVVTHFVGVGRGHVRFIGRPDHAGTTPMHLRRDALRGASDFVLELPLLPLRIGLPSAVATVGRVDIASGARNVVPGDVTVFLDFRDHGQGTLEVLEAAIIELGRECGLRHELEIEYFRETLTDPVPLPPTIPDLVEDVARELGISTMRMHSGASHDAQIIARIAPAGMIFVPSRDGRSHSPLEATAWEDVENGANVLLGVVRRLACEPSGDA